MDNTHEYNLTQENEVRSGALKMRKPPTMHADLVVKSSSKTRCIWKMQKSNQLYENNLSPTQTVVSSFFVFDSHSLSYILQFVT